VDLDGEKEILTEEPKKEAPPAHVVYPAVGAAHSGPLEPRQRLAAKFESLREAATI
jgi:hypothetical protein